MSSRAILILVVHSFFRTFYSFVVNPCFRTFLIVLSSLHPVDFCKKIFITSMFLNDFVLSCRRKIRFLITSDNVCRLVY